MTPSSAAMLLRRFLFPNSIAVIGATAVANKAGGRRWLSALEARSGGARLYPINPGGGELNRLKVYRTLREVPEPVDLATILVPSAHVRGAVEDCAATSVGAVVVISAGFGETGAKGKEEELRLAELIQASGGRMLGPNSAGVFGAAGGINTLGWAVPKGDIGLVTQSGNMALTFTNFARVKRAGFASILALGNAADLKLSEVVEMLLTDDATRAVLIYCEGFAHGDGRRLVEVLCRAGGAKPVVMLKPGTSEAGKQAILSHTGALAGDDTIAEAALADAGVVLAAQAEEAFDIAHALTSRRRLLGRAIAVLADGGGHAAIVSDCLGRRGLRLARFAPETAARLREILPLRASVNNPVDFAGVAESEPSCVPRALGICLADPGVAGVVFAGHFGGYHLMTRHAPAQGKMAAQELQAAADIATAVGASDKPCILHSEHAERGLQTLEPIHQVGVPIYGALESAAWAMAALAARLGPQHTDAPQTTTPATAPAGGRLLLEPEARERMTTAGLPVPLWRTMATSEEARAAFHALSKGSAKVVLKLVCRLAVHKSDVGGVLLGIDTADAAAKAHDHLMAIAHRLGDARALVLMTPNIHQGTECLIGARHDPQFGPVVLFGAGGVLVELMHDVAIRLAPLDADSAADLIGRTKIGRLLAGYRRSAATQQRALAELLAGISRFVADTPDLLELDLNPVIVNDSGVYIADARMVIRP
jgi:acyl-CoA synthetase (NDP forming)